MGRVIVYEEVGKGTFVEEERGTCASGEEKENAAHVLVEKEIVFS